MNDQDKKDLERYRFLKALHNDPTSNVAFASRPQKTHDDLGGLLKKPESYWNLDRLLDAIMSLEETERSIQAGDIETVELIIQST